MQCINPILIKKGKIFPEIFEVPCGVCVACKIQRVREWTVRIIHEMRYFKYSVFATLTYNEENLPLNYSLDKKEFQKFMKRLRKALGEQKVKYFACGEYGEESQRPHYHAIILGLRYDDVTQKLIEENWKHGFVKLGTVTKDSIRYTVDYMHKKYNGELGKKLYESSGRECPFQLVSQGMGKRHALDSIEQYAENLYMTYNGKKMGLPRYYRKLYGITSDMLRSQAIKRASERYEELMSRGDCYLTEKSKAAHQRERNILANMRERNKI